MKKISFDGGAMLSPVPPTMVSCGHDGSSNIITVAWTGIMCTKPPITYISLRPERFSHKLIKESGEFVINLVPASLAAACDTCGVKSGRDTDKFKLCALHRAEAVSVSAPLIDECPVNIECRVRETLSLGSHDVFIADILKVDVDSSLIDQNGRIRMWKAELLAYAHGSYYTLGRHLGDFGFSVRKKKKRKK